MDYDLVAIGGGADYDEDGYADFVASDDRGALLLARGTGHGQFNVQLLSTRGAELKSIGGGADFDGDGHADFVTLANNGSADGHADLIATAADGGGYLYAGNGDGSFSARWLGAGWDWVLFLSSGQWLSICRLSCTEG